MGMNIKALKAKVQFLFPTALKVYQYFLQNKEIAKKKSFVLCTQRLWFEIIKVCEKMFF